MIMANVKKVRIDSMELDEISLVGSGDDPQAKVIISKAAPDKNTSNDGSARHRVKMEEHSTRMFSFAQGLLLHGRPAACQRRHRPTIAIVPETGEWSATTRAIGSIGDRFRKHGPLSRR